MLVSLSVDYQWWLIVGGLYVTFTFSELPVLMFSLTMHGYAVNNLISKLVQLSIPKPAQLSVCPSLYLCLQSTITVTHLSNGGCQPRCRTLYKYRQVEVLHEHEARYNTWPRPLLHKDCMYLRYCLSGKHRQILINWAVNDAVLVVSYSCSTATVKAV